MSCPPRTPVFWQRQPRLPRPVVHFLGVRLGAALVDPADRALLSWPAILGAPRLRETRPEGLDEAELVEHARPMIGPILPDGTGPGDAWRDAIRRFPDTADRAPEGWIPHRIWEPLASLVSLRSGVTLLALLGLPVDGRYRMAAVVSLFNAALYQEARDALEGLLPEVDGDPRRGIQGMLQVCGGYHDLQIQNAPSMAGQWEDALESLEGIGNGIDTPWGRVGLAACRESIRARLGALDDGSGERAPEPPWERLWSMDRPEWELT